MKTILLLAALSLNSISFAKTKTVAEDLDSSAIEALNAYCGSSTQMYWSQISSVRVALKAGKLSDSQLDEAISALSDLNSEIKDRCN